MPTNTYSVEAEITREVVVEVEATSQQEAEDLVGVAYKIVKDTQYVSIGSLLGQK